MLMKRCLGVPKAKQKAVLLVLLSETPKPKCHTGLYSSWVLYLEKLLFCLCLGKNGKKGVHMM